MSKSPAFQFYPQDYLASTRVAEMTLEEEGVYIRLLCYCWSSGSIPADPERCARLAGKGCSVAIATNVQRAFSEHPTDTTRLVHDRLEIERENQRKRREQASEAGKKSAESRSKNSKTPAKHKELNDRSTTVQRKRNTSSSISSSISSSKEEGEQAAVAAPPTDWQEQILEAFDETFGTSSRLTAARAKHLNARWRDPWWQENWQLALERGGESAFLRGANDRGWVIDFEFFLRPDTATKILEGKYDDRQQHSTKLTTNQQRENNTAAVFDRFRKAAAEATASGLIGGGSVSGRIDAAG